MLEEGRRLVEKLKDEYELIGAFKYCEVVFFGEEETAVKTKQSCLRFLRALDEQDSSEYKFDKDLAIRMHKFASILRLKKSNDYFRPSLYQLYILQQVAWRDSEGIRKYNKYYISMGRKQGKSYVVAIQVLFEFLLGEIPERNQEIILTSRSENQAKLIYGMVSDMLRGLIKDGASFGGRLVKDIISLKKGMIENLDNGGKIEFYASEADSVDGTEPDLGIIDEYALMKNGKAMRTAIETGQTYIKNSLLIMLSTVSDDLNSDMYKEYGLVTKILNGEHESERYFIFIAELDEYEEWKEKKNWSKANPLLLDESIKEGAMEAIERMISDDMAKGQPVNSIVTKSFNMWGKTTKERYLDYDIWEDSVKEGFNKKGRTVYIGLDLSERSDLTGISFLFEAGTYIYIDSHAFVAGRKQDKGAEYLKVKSNADQFDYIEASKEGDITISENLIDYDEVWAYIYDYIEEHNLKVKGLYFDPRFVAKFLSMQPDREVKIPLEYVRQDFDTISEPLVEFKDNLIDGRIRHSNNSFLNYCVKNANMKNYRNGYLIEKPSESLRIDSLDATITGYVDLVEYDFTSSNETGYEKLLKEINSGTFSF